MTPLISIVIPCHNARHWLRTCVKSALAQTWPRKEVIVVNDGSTDDSSQILREFGDAVHLLQTPRRGAPYARNEALATASGEWIQFLDADDYLEPCKIARQLAESPMRQEVDVLYSPVIVETWSEGTAQSRLIIPINHALDLYEQWIAFQLPQTGAALWRADSLRRIGGWDENLCCCQDTDLYLRALKAGLNFLATTSSHAVYRIWSEETLCRRNPLTVIAIRTRLVQELIRWLKNTGRLERRHLRAAGRACLEMARTFARRDLQGAAAYFAARRTEGLIALEGPAAPFHYRLVYSLFGFRSAERIAAMMRA